MSVDTMSNGVEKEAIFDLIRATAARLDDEALAEWLALFAPGASYEITTYGPEIGSEMAWWRSNRDELATILGEAKQHVRDQGKRLHLITPISAEIAGDRATASSHFAIVRTDSAGKSAIYAAGRYDDRVIKVDGHWLYEQHRVMLDTRMLEPFTHLPL
jgi:anthranilate 1,2-dioxygenase small subunit